VRRGPQAVLLAMVIGTTSAVGQTKGPIPLPGPTIVPPAGLSPLLTEPGPVYPTPERALPAYPSPQYPGPIGQQNLQSYRNSLKSQQWQLERDGVSPGSERSREIQQQLNPTSSPQ
jgi:hypothetical protein